MVLFKPWDTLLTIIQLIMSFYFQHLELYINKQQAICDPRHQELFLRKWMFGDVIGQIGPPIITVNRNFIVLSFGIKLVLILIIGKLVSCKYPQHLVLRSGRMWNIWCSKSDSRQATLSLKCRDSSPLRPPFTLPFQITVKWTQLTTRNPIRPSV